MVRDLAVENDGAGNQKIFLMEDDLDIARLVRHNLEAAGFRVRSFSTTANVITDAQKERPSLMLLDIMVPGGDGLDLCRQVRQSGAPLAGTPIVFLTAKTSETDRILGLELGADDYIGKPFSPGVLLSRIKAVLRRAETPPQAPVARVLKVDARLSIDFDRHEVWKDGEKVQLRPTEFRLLYHLASNPGVVMTHETLLSRVWGPEYRDASHYVRLYINYLRQKLEDDPANPHYILTERGVGYRFADLSSAR